MRRPFADLRRALIEAAVTSPGRLPEVVRRALVAGAPLDGPLGAWVATVRDDATRSSTAQVAQLKALGHSEAELFEATVCAALSAGLSRFDRARAVMEAADASSDR